MSLASFALVAEGVTDLVVLEFLLQGFFNKKVRVIQLQPELDATDQFRQNSHGGWGNVLNYCQRNDLFRQALKYNDYIVIQIDTDCCHEFGVDVVVGGVERTSVEIVEEVKKIIIGKIGESCYKEFGDKIIFAISVQSIECWIIPLHIDSSMKISRERSCADGLSGILARKSIKYEKKGRCYEVIARDFKKRKNIEAAAKENISFEIFIKSLPNLNIED